MGAKRKGVELYRIRGPAAFRRARNRLVHRRRNSLRWARFWLADKPRFGPLMNPLVQRRLLPLAAVALIVGASFWALSHDAPPPADLTFCNGTEIKTIDPAKITGQPEGRIVDAIFEGLCRRDPVDLHVIPGMAE